MNSYYLRKTLQVKGVDHSDFLSHVISCGMISFQIFYIVQQSLNSEDMVKIKFIPQISTYILPTKR
jgi:hypothetical protein